MATRRTNTAKPAAEKEVEAGMMVEEVKTEASAKVPVDKKKETVVKKTTFEPTRLVTCTSVTAGELILIGKKTGIAYHWYGYGDTQDVEFQDLQASKLTRSQYIYEPLFMIEDQEVLDTWTDVQDMYNSIYASGDIMEIIKLDNATFRQTITNLPIGIKNTLKTTVYDMVEAGTLDSLKKIKIIDDVLGTDIMSMIVD